MVRGGAATAERNSRARNVCCHCFVRRYVSRFYDLFKNKQCTSGGNTVQKVRHRQR